MFPFFLFLGNFASFNFDTSKTSNLKTVLWTQYHLANQYYNVCIRRSRGYCSICYSPEIIHTVPTAIATEGSSFGVSAASLPAADLTVAQGPSCTGITTSHATDASAVGLGMFSIEHKKEKNTLFDHWRMYGLTINYYGPWDDIIYDVVESIP